MPTSGPRWATGASRTYHHCGSKRRRKLSAVLPGREQDQVHGEHRQPDGQRPASAPASSSRSSSQSTVRHRSAQVAAGAMAIEASGLPALGRESAGTAPAVLRRVRIAGMNPTGKIRERHHVRAARRSMNIQMAMIGRRNAQVQPPGVGDRAGQRAQEPGHHVIVPARPVSGSPARGRRCPPAGDDPADPAGGTVGP